MGTVNGTERVRFHRGESLAAIAKAHHVKESDITRADGTAAPEKGLMPGETLFIHHTPSRPNRAEAIIRLLAEATSARAAAEQAQSQVRAQKDRQDALTKAADGFNSTVRGIRDQLGKGEASTCTLADREKIVAGMKAQLDTANKAVTALDASAQMPAQDVVDNLVARASRLETRAKAEQAMVDKLNAQIDGDAKAMGAAVADTHHMGKIGSELKELTQKYADPGKLVQDLPADAQKALTDKIAALHAQLDRNIVRFSNESDVDEQDNSYLLGRPGPKMRKAADTVDAFLAQPAGPVSEDQRAKVIRALNDMHSAVGDFDDPMTKAAAQRVYDDLSAKSFARLASGK